MTPTTPRIELAAAVRRVNAAYLRSGEPDLDLGADVRAVEAEIDRAMATEDREAALAAIGRWEQQVTAEIRGAR